VFKITGFQKLVSISERLALEKKVKMAFSLRKLKTEKTADFQKKQELFFFIKKQLFSDIKKQLRETLL
jgi:hypothetical protein